MQNHDVFKILKNAERSILSLPVNLAKEYIQLKDMLWRTLAEDLIAEADVPHFKKSAYDGFAVIKNNIESATKDNPVTLNITELIPAGSLPAFQVTSGTAARIMTGAKVPDGADAIIPYEATEYNDTQAKFFGPAQKTSNIIEIGEDLKKGEVLIEAGVQIRPAEAAAFASQGKTGAVVYKKPKIAVISTGSELIRPGEERAPGKIYNSNSTLICGILEIHGAQPIPLGIVEDDLNALSFALCAAFEQSDAIITTGGVSAGDFDYMSRAAIAAGAKILFHKLPFKPGGAMLAAEKNGKLLLALSGNPSAAAGGLHLVGLPHIKRLCGLKDTALKMAEALLSEPVKKTGSTIRLLWGCAEIRDTRLYFCPIKTQRNGAISSMFDCTLIAEIPPGESSLNENDRVKVYILSPEDQAVPGKYLK